MKDLILDEYVEPVNKVYARANENGIVTHIFSEAFESPLSSDICIDSNNTERHGAQNYKVVDDNGIYNYEIKNKVLCKRDKTEDLNKLNKINYKQLVQQKIRSNYTIDDELAIQRQKDTKPEEFKIYNDFCEQCKVDAKVELNIYADTQHTYIQSKPQPTEQELNDMIIAKIRSKYTVEQELDIIEHRYSNPQQYQVYSQYCEQCEIDVKNQYLSKK